LRCASWSHLHRFTSSLPLHIPQGRPPKLLAAALGKLPASCSWLSCAGVRRASFGVARGKGRSHGWTLSEVEHGRGRTWSGFDAGSGRRSGRARQRWMRREGERGHRSMQARGARTPGSSGKRDHGASAGVGGGRMARVGTIGLLLGLAHLMTNNPNISLV
jgi:hypothetical protein